MEVLLQPAFLGLFFVLAALSALIPAFMVRWIMDVKFLHRVSFLAVLLILAASYVAMILVYAWLGLFERALAEEVPLVPGMLLAVAGTALQLILLTAFVLDEHGQMIPMWQWLVALLLQWVVYVVLSILLTFVVIAVALLMSSA